MIGGSNRISRSASVCAGRRKPTSMAGSILLRDSASLGRPEQPPKRGVRRRSSEVDSAFSTTGLRSKTFCWTERFNGMTQQQFVVTNPPFFSPTGIPPLATLEGYSRPRRRSIRLALCCGRHMFYSRRSEWSGRSPVTPRLPSPTPIHTDCTSCLRATSMRRSRGRTTRKCLEAASFRTTAARSMSRNRPVCITRINWS